MRPEHFLPPLPELLRMHNPVMAYGVTANAPTAGATGQQVVGRQRGLAMARLKAAA